MKNANQPETTDFKDYTRNLIVIGVVTTGASVFGYFQLSFFYTYIESVLVVAPLAITLMAVLTSIVALVSIIFFGIISDNTRSKLGRRRPFILLGIIAGLGIFWFGFIDNYWAGLFIKLVVVEITINGYYAVQRLLIADLIPIEHRGKANGVNGLISMIGMIIAVLATLIAQAQYVIGGDLNQEGHIFLFTLCMIIVISCSIGGFLFLKEPSVEALPPKKTFVGELRETFQVSELRKHNEYFKMLLAQGVFMIGLLMIAPYIFIYIFELELSSLDMTFIAATIAPVMIIVILLLGKLSDKYGRKKIIPPTFLISCIGFFMMPFVATKELTIIPLAAIAINLALIGFVGVLVPVSAWQQDLYPEEKRGQFVGILNAINMLMSIPGVIVGGIVYAAFGLQWVFVFVPIPFIASIPLFLKIEDISLETITDLRK